MTMTKKKVLLLTQKSIIYDKNWYEEAPYCRSRARGIKKIVEIYQRFIRNWVALDDLPLDSSQQICIPQAEDIQMLIEKLSISYFREWVTIHQTNNDVNSNNTNNNTNINGNINGNINTNTITNGNINEEQYLAAIMPCVQYALNLSLFSRRSQLFGWEYSSLSLYYQAMSIAVCISLTYEIKDINVYNRILTNLMSILYDYCKLHTNIQGDPSIAEHLIRTDQNIGLKQSDVIKAVQMLTMQNQHDLNIINRTEEIKHEILDKSITHVAETPLPTLDQQQWYTNQLASHQQNSMQIPSLISHVISPHVTPNQTPKQYQKKIFNFSKNDIDEDNIV